MIVVPIMAFLLVVGSLLAWIIHYRCPRQLIKISIAYVIVIGGVTFYHAVNRYMMYDVTVKRLSLNNSNVA